MFNKFDLVKVIEKNDKDFYGAIGIIDKVDKDIEDIPLYRLLFVGEFHNKVAEQGIPYFYDEELEEI